MEKIYLAFYKGKGTIADKFIRWWTNSKYSHAEVVIGEPKCGVWISSSVRDGGVRKKKVNYKPENWDIVELSDKMSISENMIYSRYNRIDSCAYDWFNIVFNLGVLNFMNYSNKCMIDSKNRFVCSECCAYLLGIDEPCRFDPGDLAQWAGLSRK